MCCRPREEGGLGIRRIADMVTAFSMKLWCNLRSSNSLWSCFMMKKYCPKSHLLDCSYKSGSSCVWQRMMRVKDITEGGLQWVVGEGKIG